MEIGDILKNLREIKSLTQIELAEKAGIDTSSVHRYESGKSKVSSETLNKVTKALDITVPDVYAIKENPSILEEPFTYFRGKSLNTIQIMVTLDGTLSTLNSWFATLKKVNSVL